LDSTQNSELECIFKPFGLSHVNKSVWALGLYGQFTITMSSSKRLQRDRATPTVQIPVRFINSRLNAQYLPSYIYSSLFTIR